MGISQEALEYLANNVDARKILGFLDSKGRVVLAQWYEFPEGYGGNRKDVFGVLIQEGDLWRREGKYEGQRAEEADRVARHLDELGILELNSVGWCSHPVQYALKGEWCFFRPSRGMISYRYEPNPEERRELLKLIA